MKILNKIIFLLLTVILSGCLDKLPEEGSGNFCPGIRLADGACPFGDAKIWNFNIAGSYSYNSNYVEISSGAATLKEVDQIFSGTDFNNGIHVGTYLDSNNNLTLKTKLHDSLNVKNILPSKTSNLVGYWRMDGDWSDSSGNGLSMNPVNSPELSTISKIGSNAGKFSGVNQYSQINYTASLNPNQFTFSCWTRVTGEEGTYRGPLTSRGNSSGYQFYAGANDKWQLWAGDGAVYQNMDGINITLGEWVHLTGSYDGTTLFFYVNGQLVNSLVMNFVPNTTSSTYIGSANGNFYYPGEVDEVTIWNTSLSASEISSLYTAQSFVVSSDTQLSSEWTPKWGSIAGYWKMEGNWQDSSGNASHGSPSGDTIFSDTAKVGAFAASFDGAGDSFSTNYMINNGTHSVCTWLNFRSLNSVRAIGSHDGARRFYFGVDSDNDLFVGFGDSHTGSGSVTDTKSNFIKNEWYHYCVSGDGSIASVYIDGELKVSFPYTWPGVSTNTFYAGLRNSSSPTPIDGLQDELSIWNTTLTQTDISIIYNRQKQKYSGHYDSAIVDLGSSSNWTNLSLKTPLPFMKEIPLTSENVSDYSSLIGDLSDGLVGYWPLNEKVFNGVGGKDSEDKSSNSNHLSESGIPGFGIEGIVSRGINFDGVDDYLLAADHNSLDLSSNLTLSIWMKSNGELDDTGVSGGLLGKHTFGGTVSYAIRVFSSSYEFLIRQSDGSYIRSRKNFTPKVVNGKWNHLVGVANSSDGTLRVYVNGVLQTDSINNTFDGTIGTSLHNFIIGMDYGGASFNGSLDEAMVFDRALSSIEVHQLYRRGSNRLKYQVRSCDDTSCDTEKFQGPDGTGATYFSEIHNNDTIDGNAEAIGNIQTSFPQFNFSSFVSAPLNNRYFQYRVYMESDDENNLCSGLPCMPELTSVELGPSGRYFGGTPTVVTNSPITYEKINSITISESGTCSIGYQLSKDGTNFYFWNGTTWAAVSGDLDRNPKADVSTNIKKYSSQFGAGSLYVKAYLISDTSQSCSLKDIRIENIK